MRVTLDCYKRNNTSMATNYWVELQWIDLIQPCICLPVTHTHTPTTESLSLSLLTSYHDDGGRGLHHNSLLADDSSLLSNHNNLLHTHLVSIQDSWCCKKPCHRQVNTSSSLPSVSSIADKYCCNLKSNLDFSVIHRSIDCDAISPTD